MSEILHGPKPAEEWAEAERFDSLDQLAAYDYVPVSPSSVNPGERGSDVEKRILWQWTVMESYRAIIRVWPGKPA